MTRPIPAGSEGLIPHLICDPCAEAIEFYKEAFGAEEVGRMPSPDGSKIMHAEIRIGGRPLMLADAFPEFCEGGKSPKDLGGTAVTIHRYVEDCDAAIQRAADAGATVSMPAADMFWGDRYGVVVDPFGHSWSIATRISEPTPEQMDEAAKAFFAEMNR